jgi:hypothetical protein
MTATRTVSGRFRIRACLACGSSFDCRVGRSTPGPSAYCPDCRRLTPRERDELAAARRRERIDQLCAEGKLTVRHVDPATLKPPAERVERCEMCELPFGPGDGRRRLDVLGADRYVHAGDGCERARRRTSHVTQ